MIRGTYFLTYYSHGPFSPIGNNMICHLAEAAVLDSLPFLVESSADIVNPTTNSHLRSYELHRPPSWLISTISVDRVNPAPSVLTATAIASTHLCPQSFSTELPEFKEILMHSFFPLLSYLKAIMI